MTFKVRIERSAQERIKSWRLPRPQLLDLLNELHIDLAADPKKHLVEQIVPFANKFVCHVMIRPFPPFVDPLQATFFVVQDKAKQTIDIFAARCVKIEFPDEES